jgi:hypothetical protein
LLDRLERGIEQALVADHGTSTLILGRKSTTYSAPRYSSVWPFCRPKPLTSVTVMPETPDLDEGFAHLVELERPDDGGDQFHASVPV